MRPGRAGPEETPPRAWGRQTPHLHVCAVPRNTPTNVGNLTPGDGCRKESDGVTATLHSPDKSALGKGWGAWGEGKHLPRQRRGFPSPQNNLRIVLTGASRGGPIPQKNHTRSALPIQRNLPFRVAFSDAEAEGHVAQRPDFVAVVMSAVAHATGRYVRDLPITPSKVLATE